jgi:hypothetical protein
MRYLAVGALSAAAVLSEMRGEIRKISAGIAPFRLRERLKQGRSDSGRAALPAQNSVDKIAQAYHVI